VHADLRESDLEGADLTDSDLIAADLRGARMIGTVLTRAETYKVSSTELQSRS
jgi:uncharacterized protein YjbI with pentapeptide repeats